MAENEIWKKVPGLPAYEASSLGRIRREGRILTLSKTVRGSYKVSLYGYSFTAHNVVFGAFNAIHPIELSRKVFHINRDKADNRPENLTSNKSLVVPGIEKHQQSAKESKDRGVDSRNSSERWRRIPCFEQYDISDKGRVRSRKGFPYRILNPTTAKGGFKRVVLFGVTGSRSFYVHNLVLATFTDFNPASSLPVVHINGDKSDNRLENLNVGEPSVLSGQHPVKRSRYKGITYRKDSGKWRAQIQRKDATGKTRSIFCGLHDTEEEAVKAYLKVKDAVTG